MEIKDKPSKKLITCIIIRTFAILYSAFLMLQLFSAVCLMSMSQRCVGVVSNVEYSLPSEPCNYKITVDLPLPDAEDFRFFSNSLLFFGKGKPVAIYVNTEDASYSLLEYNILLDIISSVILVCIILLSESEVKRMSAKENFWIGENKE